MARLWPFLRAYRGRVVAALAALTVSAGTSLVFGLVLRRLVDRGFTGGDASVLDDVLLAGVGLVALIAVASFARFYLVTWLGERVVADLRKAAFDHALTLDTFYFETAKAGSLVAQLTADTTLLQSVVSTALPIALRNGLILTGGIVMLLATSPRLTLFALLAVPIVVGSIVVLGRRVRKQSRALQDRIADLGGAVEESLGAIRTVQAFGHEPHASRNFARVVTATFDAATRYALSRAGLNAFVILIVFGAIGLLLWRGGHDVVAGRITGGDLFAFIFYSGLVAGAVGALSEVATDLQRAAGATDRLFELLATEPSIRAPAAPHVLPVPAIGTVAFDDVSFRYPSRPDLPALEHLSFHVARGETVALVGPSGAGKSTVLQLLLRFYDPQSGRVLLDGVDVRDADPHDVRSRLAIVPQDPVVFSADAWTNIRYGRPDATDEAVLAAARAAHADEFLRALPEGYSTFLGERGVRLSGGQKQRIAIARAILRDPAVLLLDEATSALDSESERAVHQALETLMRGRTTLVIAHRLSTIQSADRIIVLDHGKLVEVGVHTDLVRMNGLYSRLAALQFDTGAGIVQ
ncbi:ABC transporter transmembrane domain-containing protein [Roseiterribacter gracilis]|uniref:ABC transporter transmembrane domain-containing protein n=1 Tax=Roseiterribacter gracilis TaxID=2812848 RepID=UPI003B42897D